MAKMNVKNILGELKDKLNANSIPFMEGKTPGKLIEGQVMTICDYGFINGDDGEYSVILCKEDNEHFFFGGLVLTDLLKTVDTNYTKEDISDLMEYGIKFTTERVKSKKGKREYTKVILVDDEE